MVVYCVFRMGNYRHECAGVFTTKDKAVGTAKRLIGEESDDHHWYEVIPITVDDDSAKVVENEIMERGRVYKVYREDCRAPQSRPGMPRKRTGEFVLKGEHYGA